MGDKHIELGAEALHKHIC